MADVTALGVSWSEFIRESRLSFQTLKRLDAGDPTVRPATIARAERAFTAIKAELARMTTKPFRSVGANR